MDTIEGRFRGPSPTAAAIVKEIILDAKMNPQKYGRPPEETTVAAMGEAASGSSPPEKKRLRRRIKKTKPTEL